MERVAETAELLGVEASIGSSKLEIGHATKDFIAGTSPISFLDMFEAGFMPMAVGEPCRAVSVIRAVLGCHSSVGTAAA